MRFSLVAVLVVIGCGQPAREGVDGGGEADACSGLECRVTQCEKMGKTPTTISGTVFAPNRTLALYGATVYIPNGETGALTEGAQCSRCQDMLPGGSVVNTTSDPSGRFTLTNVPSGRNIPLVIQIGKWRRRIDIPEVADCTDTPLTPDLTSLPRNKTEGDIPKIAIATGSCDALECLLRKIGVQDSEFTNDMGTGRIHLFASNGADKLMNNTPFTPAATLWNSVDKLKQYDLAMFSCECSQQPAEKSQQAMNNMKEYADFGGRVFLTHYQSIWIDGEDSNPSHAPAVWPSIAQCEIDDYDTGAVTIDQVNNPKGGAFAQWMTAVMGSTTPGVVEITEGRQSCTSIDNTKAERWAYLPKGTQNYPQIFQYTTPNEVAQDQRCGKVVFSDMHVASGSTSSSGSGFPSGCSTAAMTPQEKALAFMLFDISSCLNPIF